MKSLVFALLLLLHLPGSTPAHSETLTIINATVINPAGDDIDDAVVRWTVTQILRRISGCWGKQVTRRQLLTSY